MRFLQRGIPALVAFALVACQVRPVAGEPSSLDRLHVIVVNGGASKGQNYQSHFLHVRRLLDLLARQGIATNRITVFDADGTDPEPDMAVRDIQPESDFWLLRGTRLEHVLGTQTVYANTELPGVQLLPATRAGIQAWFKTARGRLRAGDTLLVYVTDHGTKSEKADDNRITLWGDKESLPVSDLRKDLERLAPGVRVVMLMSQCFSGGFASLLSVHGHGDVPRGSVCGYFSVTPDRPAYGCYPENRGKENVGHSFHFLEALARGGSFAAAHDDVLWEDHTPDVPLRTSDVYLAQLLDRAAKAAGAEHDAFVDQLLHEAWRDKAAWEPDIRLLDRIGHAFGIFSPRSLAELEQRTKDLSDVGEQLRHTGNAWKEALGDLNAADLDRFSISHPDWASRLKPETLNTLDEPARRATTAELLTDLKAAAHADPMTAKRLHVLRSKSELAAPATYRMDVRLAALLRFRTLLTTIAGRVYVANHASAADRHAYEALRACEDLRFAPDPDATPTLAPAEPFPPFDDDVKTAHDVLPAWMGINFRPTTDETRKKLALAGGATSVLTVYPDSPALAAGLEVGDIVLGPPGRPFTEPRQIREWTMLSAAGQPQKLDVRRGDETIQITLVPKPYPVRLPELPGPPKIGSLAPELRVAPYRGTLPAALADGKPHLLFFWATWCVPCKASLPEVLAFERERDTQVIAVTDEPSEQLDAFFAHWQDPFPTTVGVDELRRAFQAYAVSGTPTYVLVDGEGHVRSQTTGYTPEKSLGIEGWKWDGKRP